MNLHRPEYTETEFVTRRPPEDHRLAAQEYAELSIPGYFQQVRIQASGWRVQKTYPRDPRDPRDATEQI
jgi:hypothetical protein